MTKFKILVKGKSYLLPLEGLIISGIDMRKFMGIELKTKNTNLPLFVIDIYANFTLTQFNQVKTLDPNQIDTIKTILDLINLKIKKAECSKSGGLYITLEDHTEIVIPDSEFESWHLQTIRQERKKNSWVIGGGGTTTFFDSN